MTTTTLRLASDLWMRARRRALEEGTAANSIVVEGLEAYLEGRIVPRAAAGQEVKGEGS